MGDEFNVALNCLIARPFNTINGVALVWRQDVGHGESKAAEECVTLRIGNIGSMTTVVMPRMPLRRPL